jgi:galactose mutarotase-like enzyme
VNWGSVEVITDWQELTEANGKTLTVSTRIRALSETALVRPGFHPYFSISPNSFIDIAETHIEVAALPHDSLRVHHAKSPAAPVKLSTTDYTVTMACHISPLSEGLALAFGIWSDKKAEYVCIEPIIGKQPGPDGLPEPLTLLKEEELVMVFTIRAERAGFVD